MVALRHIKEVAKEERKAARHQVGAVGDGREREKELAGARWVTRWEEGGQGRAGQEGRGGFERVPLPNLAN